MSNSIKAFPTDGAFARALDVLNTQGCNFSTGGSSNYWLLDEALIIIRREGKRQRQEKLSSFESLSLEEVLDSFSDAPLPSSTSQVVTMREIVSRLKSLEDFHRVYNACSNSELFPNCSKWQHEHERIFLCAWLQMCMTMEDVIEIWKKTVFWGPQRRYYKFLILKRAAEILMDEWEKSY